jgi:hypothetical protein
MVGAGARRSRRVERWTTASAALGCLAALLACKQSGPKERAQPSAQAAGTGSAPTAASAAPAATPSFEELVRSTQPVTTTPADYPLGKYTVKAEVCTIEGGGPVGKSRSSVLASIAVQGNRIFVADGDEQLRGYDLTTTGGCKLKPIAALGDQGRLKLDPKVTTVSASRDRVVASSGVFGSTVLKDLKPYYKCTARPQGYVSIHPSGAFGIGRFANATVAKVTFTDTTCTSAPWVFEDLSQPTRKGVFTNVNSVGFLGDTILVGGILAKEVHPKEPRVVLGMTLAGKELFRLGNTEQSFADDGLGWVHAVSGCHPGICVLDGNYRKLAIFQTSGAFVGKVELDKLFGLGGSRTGWYGSFATAADGSLYVAAGIDRDGGKVAEGLVFRVTGL